MAIPILLQLSNTSVMGYQKIVPDRERLVKEVVNDDYVGLTQRQNYHTEAAWIKESAPLSIAYKEAREIS